MITLDKISEHFPFHIEVPHSFLFSYQNREKIKDVFGEDGFVKDGSNRWQYYQNRKWTYISNIVYFKTEDDLIEFKMRFL